MTITKNKKMQMKKEQIKILLEQFENACYIYQGVECWSVRELREILGYTQWRNFENAIEKAKESCKNSENKVSDHFADVSKTIQIPENRPLADFLPTLTIKAKDFATELTSHNVSEKDLKGLRQIGSEHVQNNQAVRKMLIERGVKPEQLPPAEDVKK